MCVYICVCMFIYRKYGKTVKLHKKIPREISVAKTLPEICWIQATPKAQNLLAPRATGSQDDAAIRLHPWNLRKKKDARVTEEYHSNGFNIWLVYG